MTDTIQRLPQRQYRGQDGPLHQPDIFARAIYIVDEMADVSALIAVQLVELRAARSQRSAGDMKTASDKIAALILQLAAMNMSLATQIAKHERWQS